MTTVALQPQQPHVKRWTKSQYQRLADFGAFKGEKVFLFRGELIEMPPMGTLHAQAVMKLTDALYRAFKPGYAIRVQLPFDVPGQSMPEPDALVCTSEAALRSPHPDQAMLVVEVSDSSLELDHAKAAEYAAAQVPEYWVIDVAARQVHAYREPEQDSSASLGWSYASHLVHPESAQIVPVAEPAAVIAVKDLLA